MKLTWSYNWVKMHFGKIEWGFTLWQRAHAQSGSQLLPMEAGMPYRSIQQYLFCISITIPTIIFWITFAENTAILHLVMVLLRILSLLHMMTMVVHMPSELLILKYVNSLTHGSEDLNLSSNAWHLATLTGSCTQCYFITQSMYLPSNNRKGNVKRIMKMIREKTWDWMKNHLDLNLTIRLYI